MASPSESTSDTDQPTNEPDQQPLRIGLWNPGETRIETELRDGLPDAEITVVGEGSNPLEIHAVDCLLADCSGTGTQAATVYDTVRDTYPAKPLVLVTAGGKPPTKTTPEELDQTAFVPRTESGLPLPLVSARCKRVSERSLTETAGDDTESETGVVPRTAMLWLAWGIAVVTYGIGDSVSTIIAVYFVEGLGESNPVVAVALSQFGIQGLFGLKFVVFLIAVGANIYSRSRGDLVSYYGPPVFVAAVGTVLTVSNVLSILSA